MKILRRVKAIFLALLAGIGAPVLVWVGVGAAFWAAFVEWRAMKAWLGSASLTCGIDTDCPPDHVCEGGKCVPRLAQ